MDEIVPGLWIGNLQSALSKDYLEKAGVTHILTCMKQRLPRPDNPPILPENMMQVKVDDLDQAPILAHFASSNDFISKALREEWVQSDLLKPQGPSPADSDHDNTQIVLGKQKRNGVWGEWQTSGEGTVLVHCQAGVSRSVAIVAAYLMATRQLSVTEALDFIRSRRKEASPNPGFIAQLELYEQVNYEIDMRHQAVRRFLMGKTSILDGDSVDDLLLSYYPSPYPSPALAHGLRGLAPLAPATGDAATSTSASQQTSSIPRKGAVKANPELSASPSPSLENSLNLRLSLSDGIDQKEEVRVTQNRGRLPGDVPSLRGNEGMSNKGSLPKPIFHGPKLRCRLCRRELAALDHIIEHEPGKGQLAFEPRKRETLSQMYSSQSRAMHSSSSRPPDDSRRPGQQTPSDPETTGHASPASSQASVAAAPAAAAADNGADLNDPERPTCPAPEKTDRKPIQSAAALSSRLPPHLAALRAGRPAQASPSPNGSNLSQQENRRHHHPRRSANEPQSSDVEGRMALTRSILQSPKCSAYFIEPMAWMSALADGEISGKLVCPGKRCGGKLGSWDWAGMQCGCGAWVTPAFALQRAKVDEI